MPVPPRRPATRRRQPGRRHGVGPHAPHPRVRPRGPGLRGVPPRPGGGDAGRRRRPRHPRRPARRAPARRRSTRSPASCSTARSSSSRPLIALQRDQVERLAEIEDRAGRAAQLNSTMSAGDQREVLESLQDGTVRFVFLAPEQLAKPEVVDAVRDAEAGAVRRRRGALRLRLGPRLPARLPAAGRRHRAARPPHRAGAHRDRGAAGAGRDRRAAGDARRRRSSSPASTGPRSGWRSTTTPTPTASSRACSTGCWPRSARAAARASSTAPPAGAPRRSPSSSPTAACGSGRTTRGCARPSARTPSGPGWTTSSTSSSPPPRSAWASTSRTPGS